MLGGLQSFYLIKICHLDTGVAKHRRFNLLSFNVRFCVNTPNKAREANGSKNVSVVWESISNMYCQKLDNLGQSQNVY